MLVMFLLLCFMFALVFLLSAFFLHFFRIFATAAVPVAVAVVVVLLLPSTSWPLSSFLLPLVPLLLLLLLLLSLLSRLSRAPGFFARVTKYDTPS